ncbi:hypothetical protein Mrad2831_4243 [Methylobacterium radiotolerans JCM 2831]|uniref:Uncharacterized protein n=1 Tax=Methylobacterium radiotolerans (strain ATCC 27329 / DSM 1819 / JCM 2831 / NBRC 15690 / NCIMB 10815 / 0-1) TaxID=426355 RepID=B1M2H0_METRJ|nr:hypothetical protein Mrad2831_4243 [Methylobacterium radiotolerans JCM 2831]GEN01864.1 hypothetical protein MRA01_64030 [Methylobacterium radiotolerans]
MARGCRAGIRIARDRGAEILRDPRGGATDRAPGGVRAVRENLEIFVESSFYIYAV